MSRRNLLLQEVDYQVTETRRGRWRRYLYPTGELFEEFVSHRRWMGWPLLHYTRGRCPETGKRIVARGVVAVGRLAVGAVAVGHAAAGLVAVGQLGLGLLLGLGQAATGLACAGQVALGVAFGLGQLATGYTAVGQVAAGHYVLAQIGWGEHVWDVYGISPQAEAFFRPWLPW